MNFYYKYLLQNMKAEGEWMIDKFDRIMIFDDDDCKFTGIMVHIYQHHSHIIHDYCRFVRLC